MNRIEEMRESHARSRAFFASGMTRSPAWRIEQLAKLGRAIEAREETLIEALRKDLGKPMAEAYLSEIGWVLNDIRHAIRHVKRWSRPRRCPSPPAIWPARSLLVPEPAGVVLILAPWNYPFQLLLSPCVAAMAAGNAVWLKPSELTPSVSHAMAALLRDTFSSDYLAVWEGERETAEALLSLRFDHIFFTGSTAVGRRVMAAAAQFPTPTTLELGGKSPCIVLADADLRVAARRIAWGKFMNAGQTCVAPDYVLVERSARDELVAELRKAVRSFYGAEPLRCPHYGQLVNAAHAERLRALTDGQKVAFGGLADPETCRLEPTVLLDPAWDSPVMQEEIFGPVLPVLGFDDINAVLHEVNRRPTPLALYLFTRRREMQERILRETVSGGMAINDTIVQIFGHALPFGGVGESGMGVYHGKAGFDTFTRYRPVVTRGFRPDFAFRYPPVRLPARLLKLISRRFMG